jgi:hypothetical protein
MGKVGASTAMPAVPRKGNAVQQWKCACVVSPERPENVAEKFRTWVASSKVAVTLPVPVRPPATFGFEEGVVADDTGLCGASQQKRGDCGEHLHEVSWGFRRWGVDGGTVVCDRHPQGLQGARGNGTGSPSVVGRDGLELLPAVMGASVAH